MAEYARKHHKNDKLGHFYSFFDHFLPIQNPRNKSEIIEPPPPLYNYISPPTNSIRPSDPTKQ